VALQESIHDLNNNMSAYALPGFFPPIYDDCSSSSSFGDSFSFANAVFGSTSDTCHHESIGDGNGGTSRTPLHIQDSSISQGMNGLSLRSAVDRFYPNIALLCGPPSPPSVASGGSSSSDGSCCANAGHEIDIRHTQQQPLSQTDADATTTSAGSSSFNTLIIAVKEAKIDPVRLIQYLTGTTPQHTHRKTLRRRGSQERLQLGCSSASSVMSGTGGMAKNVGVGGNNLQVNSPIRRNKKSMVQLPAALLSSSSSSSPSPSSSSSAVASLGEAVGTNKKNNRNNNSATSVAASDNPHGGAIEFELSITFQGRRYTAKRTLQCIVQLRDDLIREMRYRKQWLGRERSRRGEYSTNDDGESSSSCISGIVVEPGLATDEQQNQYPKTGLLSPHPPTRAATGTSSSSQPQQEEQQQDPNEYIPEIPPLSTEDDRGGTFSSGKGFMGRGFTMLHAMVTSYVPVMERWLKNVMIIVPQDSECLMDFLWEPNETASSLEKDFANGISCTSLATLGSIKELEYDTAEEDSDDDEDVGYCETSWDRS
jgi:hypothetical protein